MTFDNNLTILAVDDEDIILETIEGYLSIEGCTTTIIKASNGQIGLQKFNQNKIDIVLTDLQMPGMNGIALLASIKKTNPDIPVIMISGAGRLQDSVEAFRLGAWDYILKPIDFPILINSITRAHEQTKLKAENTRYRENLEEEIKIRTNELCLRTTELEKSNEQLSKEITTRIETERRQKILEAEIQKARNLDSLGNLAGGIAHDFNNLLAALVGYIDFAGLSRKNDPELLETLYSAKKIIRMAVDLTQQLVTFSRGGSPVLRPFKMEEIIHRAIQLSPMDIDKITFHTSTPKSLWLAKGDTNQISIVLRNIYFNAIESMKFGGCISTRVSNSVVHPNNHLHLTAGRYLKIRIQDEGEGISEKDLQRIFDPYFTTKGLDSKKGKGLGLSVSYSIIKKHGGNISISSQNGEGTEVTIYLPAADS